MAKKNPDKFTEKRVKPVPKVARFFINLITLVIVLAIILTAYVSYFYFTNQKIQPEFFANIVEKYILKQEQEVITQDPIYSNNTYPKVDGSTATIPLAEAFQKNFTGLDTIEVKHSKTHQAYEALVNRQVDLILVVNPSEDELALARNAGVNYDIDKVVNEGFVFFLNKSNPVDSLTVEQIQDIYSGKINNWKEVGGLDEPIVAYQRPRNSGSQTGMEGIVMQGKEMAQAPTEQIAQGMADIIDAVSAYENSKSAIGYSYYYYANTMYLSDDIKLLKVNGVEPNNETIKSGEYPFLTEYVAVTLEGQNTRAEELKAHMLSPRGQQVAESAGYVPVN